MQSKSDTVDRSVPQVPPAHHGRYLGHENRGQPRHPRARGCVLILVVERPTYGGQGTAWGDYERSETSPAELRPQRAAGYGLPQGSAGLRVRVGEGRVLQLPPQVVNAGLKGVEGTEGGADRGYEAGSRFRGKERGQVGLGQCGIQREARGADREVLFVCDEGVRGAQLVDIHVEGPRGDGHVSVRIEGHGHHAPSMTSSGWNSADSANSARLRARPCARSASKAGTRSRACWIWSRTA